MLTWLKFKHGILEIQYNVTTILVPPHGVLSPTMLIVLGFTPTIPFDEISFQTMVFFCSSYNLHYVGGTLLTQAAS
jgi:hypothetical protein